MDDDKKYHPATKLKPTEAPLGNRLDNSESMRDLYRRLDLWNRGLWDGEWIDEVAATRRDTKATLAAVASSLDLKNHQQQAAWRFLDQLSDATRTANPTPLLAVCVSALACREDGRYFHPGRADENNDDLFLDLIERLDYSQRRVRRCYHRIEDEVLET